MEININVKIARILKHVLVRCVGNTFDNFEFTLLFSCYEQWAFPRRHWSRLRVIIEWMIHWWLRDDGSMFFWWKSKNRRRGCGDIGIIELHRDGVKQVQKSRTVESLVCRNWIHNCLSKAGTKTLGLLHVIIFEKGRWFTLLVGFSEARHLFLVIASIQVVLPLLNKLKDFDVITCQCWRFNVETGLQITLPR